MADLVRAGLSQRKALVMVGLSRSTWQYRHRPRPRAADPVPHAGRRYPNRLTADEQARVLELLRAAGQEGVSAYQAWYDALDAGEPVASLSSWYRIARAHQLRLVKVPRKRRRSAAMPQFDATGPNQVWCWDITKLPATYRGQWWNLYAVIDAFSRRIMAWRVEEVEDDLLAATMFEDAFARHGTPRRSSIQMAGPR
ncbi:DDE-type integrase/transposase/recombinase [Propionibacteriaceae bacterium G1746]